MEEGFYLTRPMKTPANPDALENCQRRKGTRTVWAAVRETRDADGRRVIIARDENSGEETDFGATEWLAMPLASDQAH